MAYFVIPLAFRCLHRLIATFNACLTPVNEVLKETVSSIYLDKNLSSLRDSLRQLQALAEKLKANVEEEEAQMRIRNPDVREWQKKADEVVIRAKPLLVKDYPTDGGSQSSTCTYGNATPFFPVRISRKVIRALQDVKDLLIQGGLFEPPFTSQPPPQEVVLHLPILRPTFGINAVMHEVWSQFNDKNMSVVGLYGLGGVGKTTLLKQFYNELRVWNDGYQFQVVIMLEVANAKTLNVVGMQRIISDQLGLPWNEDESDVDRAAFLLQMLTKKKFVVLLDDVWEKFKLDDVGIPTPLPENGSKVIVISRWDSVCTNMGAKRPIKVHGLQEDEAWILFLSKLSGNVRANVLTDEHMKQCAMEIVRRCNGLPLAIDVIGSALAVNLDPEDWTHAAAAMSPKPRSIDGGDRLLTVLKHSYNMLEDTEKKCFLYCTMFPDYDYISLEQLTEYWVAEGLISSEPYGGYTIINRLLSACLLQRRYTESALEVNMHQMIRLMGYQQASDVNKLLIKAGQALRQAPDTMEWEEATRISLMSNDIRELSISPNCSKLLTLLLQNNPNLHQLGSKFFHFMPVLKVLDLSHTAIRVLPDCSSLVQLVYLNLSYTRIRQVPKQLCRALVRLQYLNMAHTLITGLPQQLAKLEKLTHLNLRQTSALTVIPDGTISRLFKLKVLNLYKSNYGVKDLPDLNLQGLQQLTSLGITIYSKKVFRKLRKSDPLAKCTRFLSLSRCPGMKYIQLSRFQTMMHLTELHIKSCDDLEELIVDCDDENDSTRVTVLTLADLPNLTKVSHGFVAHRFQDLRDLTIHECPKLQNISWVLLLESLERLVITDCHGFKQFVQEEIEPVHEWDLKEASPVASGRNLLPRLRIMELKHLSRLESIGRTREFPCLESITLDECPNLKQLPMRSMFPKLKQISGEENWWKTIAPEVKASFGDIFVTI